MRNFILLNIPSFLLFSHLITQEICIISIVNRSHNLWTKYFNFNIVLLPIMLLFCFHLLKYDTTSLLFLFCVGVCCIYHYVTFVFIFMLLMYNYNLRVIASFSYLESVHVWVCMYPSFRGGILLCILLEKSDLFSQKIVYSFTQH